MLKGVGGVTHLLNRQDDSALLRWELCSHHLSKMLVDFEELLSTETVSICHPSTTKHHHEDLKLNLFVTLQQQNIIMKI